jgi:hypothetical protein
MKKLLAAVIMLAILLLVSCDKKQVLNRDITQHITAVEPYNYSPFVNISEADDAQRVKDEREAALQTIPPKYGIRYYGILSCFLLVDAFIVVDYIKNFGMLGIATTASYLVVLGVATFAEYDLFFNDGKYLGRKLKKWFLK